MSDHNDIAISDRIERSHGRSNSVWSDLRRDFHLLLAAATVALLLPWTWCAPGRIGRQVAG